MTAYHTLWTKPLQQSQYGGFDSWIDFYSVWAYSCLKMKETGLRVVLNTDADGATTLTEKIGLPYDQTSTDLDIINSYPSEYWSLAKLITYGSADQSFCHIDGDFICYDTPQVEDTNKLHFEHINVYENIQAENMLSTFQKFNLPDYVQEYINECNGVYRDINCGIVICSNSTLFSEVLQDAINVITDNHSNFVSVNYFNGYASQLLEQFMITAKIWSQKIPVNTLKSCHAVSHCNKYVHLFGKRHKQSGLRNVITTSLKTEYPDYYHRINQLY